MNEQELQKKIAEYMAKLPAHIRDILTDEAWINEVHKIGEKYALRPDQTNALSVEVMLGLLGIVHPAQFNEQLAKQLILPSAKINDMVDDLDAAIFMPIRDMIIDVHSQNIEEVEKTETAKKTAPRDEPARPAQPAPTAPPMAPQAVAPQPAPVAQAPAQTPQSNALLSQERKMLETSGVEVVEETHVEDVVSSPAFADFKKPARDNQADLIRQIENPVRVAPKVLNEVRDLGKLPNVDPNAPLQFGTYAIPQTISVPLDSTPVVPPQTVAPQPTPPPQAPPEPVRPVITPTFTPHTFSIYQTNAKPQQAPVNAPQPAPVVQTPVQQTQTVTPPKVEMPIAPPIPIVQAPTPVPTTPQTQSVPAQAPIIDAKAPPKINLPWKGDDPYHEDIS